MAATRPTLATVASRLTIPGGFHIANATGVDAITDPTRETGHQDVSSQMPPCRRHEPSQNRQRNEP